MRYAQAIEHFLAADALVPSAALSFNVAKAYEKLGESAKALRYYRDFARRSPGSQTSETRATVDGARASADAGEVCSNSACSRSPMPI